MERRAFLAAGAALSMTPVAAMQGLTDNSGQSSSQQYFEWIRYHLPLGTRQRYVSDYYRDVAIPALNKAGINNVGVFNVNRGINNPTLHVIIPHPTMESVVTLSDKLLDDKSFVQAGERFLTASADEAAFVTMEKTIMRAFTHLPEIQVPTQKKENKPRIFQIRTYQAHNLTASKRKIQMFNEGGEIAIFKKTGLQPVLFGETIIGNMMPNLVYMLAFDDMSDMDKKWDVFRADPEWTKLSADPYYAGITLRINDWIWTPTAFSQI